MEPGQNRAIPIEVGQKPPSSGPRARYHIAAIAVGSYTDIVAIYGPAEAAEGDQVSIQVAIRNLADYGIYIASTGRYDGTDIYLSPDYAGVDPGATYSFTVSFTMPNKDITLDIWSYYWTGTDWLQDDHEAVTIKLKALTPQFSSFGMTDYSKA